MNKTEYRIRKEYLQEDFDRLMRKKEFFDMLIRLATVVFIIYVATLIAGYFIFEVIL